MAGCFFLSRCMDGENVFGRREAPIRTGDANQIKPGEENGFIMRKDLESFIGESAASDDLSEAGKIAGNLF